MGERERKEEERNEEERMQNCEGETSKEKLCQAERQRGRGRDYGLREGERERAGNSTSERGESRGRVGRRGVIFIRAICALTK